MNKWKRRARKWRKWARQNRDTANDWRQNYDMMEEKRDALLTWQRRGREAMPVNGIVYTRCPVTHTGEGERRIDFLREDWDALRRAIESDGPKEEVTP